MSNRLLPYDTIIKAHEGDPIAIQGSHEKRYHGKRGLSGNRRRQFRSLRQMLCKPFWRG